MITNVLINYGVIDSTIAEDTVTEEASTISEFAKVGSSREVGSKTKLAYLEKDYFLLDGTFVLPETGEKYDTGYESANISDESGDIVEFIQYEFANEHSSYGIMLTFPKECIARDFQIVFFKDSENLKTIDINDNKRETISLIELVENWNRIQVVFFKVNTQQRARLSSIVFGINDTFNDDLILSVAASKTVDITGDYANAGDFSFTVFNDGVFNVKSIRELPIGLQEGLRVVIYTKQAGDENFTLFNEYYSEVTSIADNGNLITVSGYDELYQLNESIYKKGIVYPTGRSLGDWAEEVAADAGVEIEIAEKLYDIISTGYITEVPHREALRLIAEAGNCLLSTNNGIVTITAPKEEYIELDIGDDDIVDGTLNYNDTDKVYGVEVNKYTFSLANKAQELSHIEEVLITEEPQEFEVVYSTYPVDIDTVQIFVRYNEFDDPNFIDIYVENVEKYSDRCVFTIRADGETTSFITVTGTPYNQATTVEGKNVASKNIKKIENNFLITGNMAKDILDYQHSTLVNKYKINMQIVTNETLPLVSGVAQYSANLSGQNSHFAVENINFELSNDTNIFTLQGRELR